MKLPSYRVWLLLGATLGGLAIIGGSFGAHGLEQRLERDGSLSEADRDQIGLWETAARYQMYHALALLVVGLLAARRGGLAIHLAGTAMTLGTLIFCGCLYALVLSGQKWLGVIVPIGGVLMIFGWICLAIAVVTNSDASSKD
jgi:uncharacterized membrane protein YgdD (TMEM256/DUF423 family)